jgi:hypothetical protein
VNYTSLVEDIQHYTENREAGFVSLIPTFVQQAEQRIYNEVKIPALRRTQTGALTQNNAFLTVPEDYLASFTLTVGTSDGRYTSLLPKDVSFIREAYPVQTQVGVPQHYAQFDADTFILGPTPAAAYAVQLHYYYYPESIVTAGNTWLGDNFDTVLLNASLVEAYVNMKGEKDVLDMYEKQYKEALMQLKRLGEGFNQRDSFRNGEPSTRNKA